MVICADTSFLFSLYGNDVHSRRAIAWIRGCQEPLSITRLNEFELGNALRFAEFRKLIPAGMAANYWAQFQAAIAHQRLQSPICNLGSIVTEAERLSATYTLRRGHRSLDLLHVAAALHLGASDFLSFDENQKRLARAEGLSVPRMA